MTEPLPTELQEVMRDLGQCVQALGEYADNAVLTGGLAPILYRSMLTASTSSRPPMTTFDMDWVLPRPIPFHPDGLHKQLHAGGFVHFLSGGGDMPVTYYQHVRHGTAHLSPIHVEFITPRTGGMTNREGQTQGILEVENGLHAQTDPYVGLLLFEPLQFDASSIPELGLSTGKLIRVSHPMSFIVQKSLIRLKRPPNKKENDAAHMYDVAMLTFSMWDKMAAHLQQVESAGGFPKRWFHRARQMLQDLFGANQSIGVIEVARKYKEVMGMGNAPSEDAIWRVMNRFRTETGLGLS